MFKNFGEYINESKQYNPGNLVQEICVSMVLINNKFLDNLLDRGKSARYTEDSSVFLTDLKNLLIKKNRLKLGKFVGELCVEDEDISVVNNIFNAATFSIESDWNKLVNSRIVARSIIDKLLPENKLTTDMISNVFFIGHNKTDSNKEDIVIETKDGRQYPIFLNKKATSSKTSSFNKLADDLVGEHTDKLYKGGYYELWTNLTQKWVKLIYDNCKEHLKSHIDKFISVEEMEQLDHFGYYKIVNSDEQYKHLGQHFKEFDKNIKTLHDLIVEIWKGGEDSFEDFEKVESEWNSTKNVILNSKILESLLTNSIKSNTSNKIEVVGDGFKSVEGPLKMKLVKNITKKLGCSEKDLYYISTNGEEFETIPKLGFFRENYKDMDVLFDYHVRFKEVNDGEFPIAVKLLLDGKELLKLDITVKFKGGEMSNSLNAKFKFTLPKNFNYLINSK